MPYSWFFVLVDRATSRFDRSVVVSGIETRRFERARGMGPAAERPIVRRRVLRSFVIAIASFWGLGLGITDSAARCLPYEPDQVTLVGTLTSRIFPGPPNYHSIAQGDRPETIFMLTLDEPICVSGDPSSRLNSKSHSRVTEVQLVTRGLAPRRFLNKRVRASGSFFSARKGHYRTPIVLTVVGLHPALDEGDPTKPSSSDDAGG